MFNGYIIKSALGYYCDYTEERGYWGSKIQFASIFETKEETEDFVKTKWPNEMDKVKIIPVEYEVKLKMTKLNQFKNTLETEIYGMTKQKAHELGICIQCKQPATWNSEEGRKEYQISALCEPCFDSIMNEMDDN